MAGFVDFLRNSLGINQAPPQVPPTDFRAYPNEVITPQENERRRQQWVTGQANAPQTPLGQWTQRNFGYSGSFADKLFNAPGSFVPPGAPRTLVNAGVDAKNIITSPVKDALTGFGVLPGPTAPPPVEDSNKKIVADFAATIGKQLAGQAGPQTIRLPGAAKPIPMPDLPQFPDASRARQHMEDSAPIAPELSTREERIAGMLAGASRGAADTRKGEGWASVLANMGAGIAENAVKMRMADRAATERSEERIRDHSQKMALFEMEDAKNRYQAQYQTATLQWQIAAKNAELNKPQMEWTRAGLIISTVEGEDRVVKIMPMGAIMQTGDLADSAKATGATPGAGWLKEMQTIVNHYPDKSVGVSVATAHMLRTGGYIMPPGDQAGDLKGVAVKGNAELGITDEQIKKIHLLTQSQLTAMRLTPGTEQFTKAYANAFDVNLGQTMLQNPQMFMRVWTKVFGSNATAK